MVTRFFQGGVFLIALGQWVGATTLAANVLIAALFSKFAISIIFVELDACWSGLCLVLLWGALALAKSG